jgi:hypothetical protein
LLDHQENHERDDQEIDHVVQKNSVVERCYASLLGSFESVIGFPAQADEQA